MLRPFDRNTILDGQPVILYGAAMYGEIAFNALRALGIPVFAFCDRVQAGRTFCGREVISPQQLLDYPDAHVLVCATKGLEGISHYLASIDHVRSYEISELLPFVEYEKLPPYCRALPVAELQEKYRYFLKPGTPNGGEEIELPFVALSITERCDLCCEKCSVLVPYYAHPVDDSYESITTPLNRLLSCVSSVAELQIGGGEPFLHPRLGELLKWCLRQEKIREISIFTNSTILPDDRLHAVLASPKIKLLLDDYGALSCRLPDILRLCDGAGIRYVVQRFVRWDDLGDYSDRHESEEVLAEKFKYCSFGNVMSFMKGKLYRCTTAARIADLNMVPDDPLDYVDFSEEIDLAEKKKQILALLHSKRFHLGCRLCRGISTHELGIPVAVQGRRHVT